MGSNNRELRVLSSQAVCSTGQSNVAWPTTKDSVYPWLTTPLHLAVFNRKSGTGISGVYLWLMYACQYIKSTTSWIMNYAILNGVICAILRKTYFFFALRFSIYQIFETQWQEQDEKKRLVLLLKVLRKGSSMLRFLIFFF